MDSGEIRTESVRGSGDSPPRSTRISDKQGEADSTVVLSASTTDHDDDEDDVYLMRCDDRLRLRSQALRALDVILRVRRALASLVGPTDLRIELTVIANSITSAFVRHRHRRRESRAGRR